MPRRASILRGCANASLLGRCSPFSLLSFNSFCCNGALGGFSVYHILDMHEVCSIPIASQTSHVMFPQSCHFATCLLSLSNTSSNLRSSSSTASMSKFQLFPPAESGNKKPSLYGPLEMTEMETELCTHSTAQEALVPGSLP